MKIESLREVKNNFSEVIEALPKTRLVIVTKNGRSAARCFQWMRIPTSKA
jgi:prevent-host-death family protein